MKMLPRFCLYGFLKNQKYYEPFFILALRERGLDFFTIGLLVGFRQVLVNLFEIPSGFAADAFGRRKAMVFSFGAYIISFGFFAFASPLWSLFLAMTFFALGEAFRTGTHKAMIFEWLEKEGRSGERTQVYGITRSWSQVGAAVSSLLAALAVIGTQNYSVVFALSTLPYVVNIANILSYPRYLEGEWAQTKKSPDRADKTTAKSLFRQFFQVLLQTLKNRPLRRLFTESALSKGNATLAKDYVQPMLESAAMALPLLLMWEDKRRAGLLVGAVYALLSLLSGLASRGAHAFMKSSGGAQAASRKIWAGYTFAFALGMIALLSGYPGLAAMTLVMVIILQNTWRPILMGRIDAVSDGASGATILSVDSQASSFYVMVAAPLLGWLVDRYGLVPVAFFGFLTSGVMYGRALLSRKVKA